MASSTVAVGDRKFHYKLEKHEGRLYAECLELPAIIVYGKDEAEIKAELEKAIRGFIEVYGLPDIKWAAPA